MATQYDNGRGALEDLANEEDGASYLQFPVQKNKVPQPHLSRNLPYWLCFIIAKSLGIKLTEDEKPYFAALLYILMYGSAIAFIICTALFAGYDIISDYTRTTVVEGTVTIAFSIFWCALGIYANSLAFRLFNHRNFVKMLRLHSKTVFKINAALLIFTLMLLLIVINNISAVDSFNSETCHKVSLPMIVCRIRYMARVVFSVFSLLWNYLVAFVLISVCRTYTIDIRKFLQSLEVDAKFCEAQYLGKKNFDKISLDEDTWLEGSSTEEVEDSEAEKNSVDDVPNSCNKSAGPSCDLCHQALPLEWSGASTSREDFAVSSKNEAYIDLNRKCKDSVMTVQRIFFMYWRIQTKLCYSSAALQRWMMSLLCMVLLWLALNLITWLTYDPTLIDMSSFILPLLLIPLLSSAYAELNQEGQRVVKFIFPLEERTQMLRVLQNSPLEMTIYGFSLSYSSIATAFVGVLIAISTKVILQRISS